MEKVARHVGLDMPKMRTIHPDEDFDPTVGLAAGAEQQQDGAGGSSSASANASAAKEK